MALECKILGHRGRHPKRHLAGTAYAGDAGFDEPGLVGVMRAA